MNSRLKTSLYIPPFQYALGIKSLPLLIHNSKTMAAIQKKSGVLKASETIEQILV